MYIKARFIKNGKPIGREYVFFADADVSVGDTVKLPNGKGIVTAVDVAEEEVEGFKDKVKAIVGVAEKENDMERLENWTKVTRGLYRYVIAAKVCYEIHILYHAHDTDILTAKASLYIVGEWNSEENGNFFERECLLEKQPVFECIRAAVKYDKENNQ